MRICIVAEGCYPYVMGGVSGWIDSMIKSFPDAEFVVLAVIANRKQSGKFRYQLPENVTEVYEAYLDDMDWEQKGKKYAKLNSEQYSALRGIVLNQVVDWNTVFELFQREDLSINDLLMGPDFLRVVQERYDREYSQIVFSDFLWTLRSIFLPLFLILHTRLPKADLFHCVATGYSGVLGSIARYTQNCGLIISEHGIYTREREEEILKAQWVNGIYKNIWIEQFRRMSELAYNSADYVTCLYGHAKELQIDLGCPEEKIRITPNGIQVDRFVGIEGKSEEDKQYVDVGAVLRVTPIKDVKTMIRAFCFAKERVPNLRLWIMGPCDEDEQYARECFELVEMLRVEDVIFTGPIKVTDYLGKMDFTILTSISEGMPLTILESYAAGKPVVATDVGNCRELIYGGVGDEIGTSGILTHVMNVAELTEAIVKMAVHEEERIEMGKRGNQRVNAFFRVEQMKETYRLLYADVYRKMIKGQ